MNDKKKYFATVALVTLAAPTAMAQLEVGGTLLGQAGGRGNAGGLADLFGGIAQQAVRQQGGQEVTVAGLPATIAADGTLTIPLESGSILTFESSRLNSVDDALQGMGDLVNDFP